MEFQINVDLFFFVYIVCLAQIMQNGSVTTVTLFCQFRFIMSRICQ